MSTIIKVQSLGSTSFDVPGSAVGAKPPKGPSVTPDPLRLEQSASPDFRVTLSNETILEAAKTIRAALFEGARS